MRTAETTDQIVPRSAVAYEMTHAWGVGRLRWASTSAAACPHSPILESAPRIAYPLHRAIDGRPPFLDRLSDQIPVAVQGDHLGQPLLNLDRVAMRAGSQVAVRQRIGYQTLHRRKLRRKLTVQPTPPRLIPAYK